MAAMPDLETLLYDESDGVAWVTLNRPEVLNAFDTTMQRELRELWRMLRTNDDVRCVVLTGAGDKAFCTGIDREEIGTSTTSRRASCPDTTRRGTSTIRARASAPSRNDLWKPVIAAVNGMACGGAFYILGEVDFIIAAEHATFFDPHVTYGMAAAFEPIFLLQKMPFQEVMRLSLLGAHERMSAARAHQIGFVSEVVPADELQERTPWAARAIADQPALAVRGPCGHCGWASRSRVARRSTTPSSSPTSAPTRPCWPRDRSVSPPASGSSGDCAEPGVTGRHGDEPTRLEGPGVAGPARWDRGGPVGSEAEGRHVEGAHRQGGHGAPVGQDALAGDRRRRR